LVLEQQGTVPGSYDRASHQSVTVTAVPRMANSHRRMRLSLNSSPRSLPEKLAGRGVRTPLEYHATQNHTTLAPFARLAPKRRPRGGQLVMVRHFEPITHVRSESRSAAPASSRVPQVFRADFPGLTTTNCARVFTRRAVSTGLVRCSSKPAARAASRSSLRANAVRAMAGTRG
jgi:hypothetical protein